MNRFPLWKYVLLLVVLLIGFVYAVPNLFGVDPALQITGSSVTVKVDPSTETKIVTLLKQHKLSYRDTTYSNEGNALIIIRFADTQSQLAAKDVLKQALGQNYTVAVNLVPKTPRWLSAVGANPMKLGLDLRGGMHLLLKVDVQSAIVKRQKGLLRNMGDELRQARVRYRGMQALPQGGGVVLRFKDEATLKVASDLLNRKFQQMQWTRNDAGGVYRFKGEMYPAAMMQMRQEIVDQTMTVLRNRVNELGVSEPLVQQQGQDQIVVDLPGIQDAAQAKQILGSTATIEFRLVDNEHDAATAMNGAVPFGSKLYQFEGRPRLLKTQIVLDGKSINSATSGSDQSTGSPSVNLTVSGPEVPYFNRITRENINKGMATVYIETKTQTQKVKGKLITKTRKIEKIINIATIQSALGYQFQITGLGSPMEAQKLSLLLRAGALPANMYPIEESIVGPSLGKDNIKKGMLSVEVGFMLIVIFMALYYRAFGLCADVALFANLVLLTALMSLIGATLTLPAIAGMVLTLGMAVDANVLIFERVREELRNGMTPQASISAGFDRAFTTIVDSNVTTIIAAGALFALGSGPVKGFAVTLTLGILTSMFTAITGTRALVNLLYGGKTSKKLSIGI